MAAHTPPDSSPLVYDIVHFPVVCTTVVVCIFTFAWINRDAAARVAACAFSFKAIVTDGQIIASCWHKYATKAWCTSR
jgi:hypothetical protein